MNGDAIMEMRMKILVAGQGGREHALCVALAADSVGPELFCWPGSDAIRELAASPEGVTDVASLVGWMAAEGIDLVVAGQEKYLADGLQDLCAEAGIRCFGPSRHAAQLETSKAFAKSFMDRHKIPTAAYTVVDSEADLRAASTELPVVLKFNGLAAGKGVSVCHHQAAVDEFCERVYTQELYGKDTVVVEECMVGPELSVICAVAGGAYRMFPRARDYKPALDGDQGPNTGGMGAVASKDIIDAAMTARIEEEVVRPAVAGLEADGLNYHGFLYFGLMLTETGPRMLEFNCRFGDPEAQAVLPLLEGDFAQYLYKAAASELDDSLLAVKDGWSVGVILASAGYPASSRKGDVIRGDGDVGQLYHSGTRREGEGYVTNGGRVLCCVAHGTTREEAVRAAYAEAEKVSFPGMQRRNDIGLANF